jgi:tetratricopeptide (TPR) repeat protein
MTFELNRPTTMLFVPHLEQEGDPAPSSTGVEQAIADGSRHADAGDDAAAERAYRHADDLLGNERSPRHAEVLVCLALLARRRGDLAQAAQNLDIALAIFPEHRAALSQRLALAHEQSDLAAAAALRARMLAFCESAEARAHVLSEIVDDALEAAASALRQAIGLRPNDIELRERLRSLLEATFDYDGAVDASVALAESLSDPSARASVLAQGASLCAKKVGNVDRAVALFEAAIADDPTVAGAFEAIETVLVEAGDVDGTERAYSRQIERLRAGGHQREEAALLHKLAILREEQLSDAAGAITALERATQLRPDDVPSRLTLARVLERQGASDAALSYLEGIARIAPTDRTSFREMHRIALSATDFDRAFFAASVLVHMGEADEAEQATYRQFASYGAPGASQSLDEGSLARLRPSEHPVRTLLLVIHDAALAARQSMSKAGKAPPLLDERERQDPEQSTVSAVRVVAWTARLLGLPSFALYVRPGQSFALSHPMSAAPALVLGSGMLSGRSVPELLFRAGYELGALRELGRLPVFYPKAEDLQNLVAAAIGLCQPAKLPSNAIDLAKALDSTLDDQVRARLRAMVDAATKQQLDLDVSRMLRDLELVAGRIGMVACTDLTVAARQVAIESRATQGLSPSDRVRDLLAFAVSGAHAEVRANLGMAVGSSKSIPT